MKVIGLTSPFGQRPVFRDGVTFSMRDKFMKPFPYGTCLYIALWCVWWTFQDYIVVSESVSNILFALIVIVGTVFIFLTIVFFAIGSYKEGNVNQLPFANETLRVSIIFVLFLLIILFAPKDGLPKYSGKLKFESALWQSEQGTKRDWTYITPRQKMIKDLFKNILPGMTKTEVIELLGPPDTGEYAQKTDVGYWLGPQRSFGVDHEWLLIYFEDDKITKTEIYVD